MRVPVDLPPGVTSPQFVDAQLDELDSILGVALVVSFLAVAAKARAQDARRWPAARRRRRGTEAALAGLGGAGTAALLPLFAFWPTTGYGLMLDDLVLFEKSPTLSDLGSIADGFTKDVGALRKGAETVNSSYYRPIFLAISTLYHQAVGGSPADWHRLCVFLAAAIGALAAGFFLRLGLPPWLALAASAVFSLHPSHVGSIAWASGLQELLAAFFVLLAVARRLCGAPARRQRRYLRPGASCSSFWRSFRKRWRSASCLSSGFGRWPSGRRIRRRRGGWAGWPGAAGALTLVYLVVRMGVLEGRLALPAAERSELPGFAAGGAGGHRNLPAPAALAFRLLDLPARSGPSFRPSPRRCWSRSWCSPPSPRPAIWAIRRQRELALPLAFFGCLLLPVLNLWVLDPQWMVTDRYLFLPSLALPWVLALVLPRKAAIAVSGGPGDRLRVASRCATARSSRTSAPSWRRWSRPSRPAR